MIQTHHTANINYIGICRWWNTIWILGWMWHVFYYPNIFIHINSLLRKLVQTNSKWLFGTVLLNTEIRFENYDENARLLLKSVKNRAIKSTCIAEDMTLVISRQKCSYLTCSFSQSINFLSQLPNSIDALNTHIETTCGKSQETERREFIDKTRPRSFLGKPSKHFWKLILAPEAVNLLSPTQCNINMMS